jgi:hypothetical protein
MRFFVVALAAVVEEAECILQKVLRRILLHLLLTHCSMVPRPVLAAASLCAGVPVKLTGRDRIFEI